MRHLISGGARSGKSRHAENLALAHAGPVTYIATAERRTDAAFLARIAHHSQRRPASWGLVEAGQDLAAAIASHDQPDGLLLIDCLGMWLMRFFDGDGRFDMARWLQQREALLAALAACRGEVILVSNEVGWGVVPLGQETRDFVDELGRLNQSVAEACEKVSLVACGLPLALKG